LRRDNENYEEGKIYQKGGCMKKKKIYIIEEKRNWRAIFHVLTAFLYMICYIASAFTINLTNVPWFVVIFYWLGFWGSSTYIVEWLSKQTYEPKKIRKEIEIEEV